MVDYIDKKLDDVGTKKGIKTDVREEFKRIDRWGYRDDQEIYSAGCNVLNRYRTELLNSNRLVKQARYIVKDGKPVFVARNNEYRKEAKKIFDKTYNDFVRKHNSVSGRRLTSSNTNKDLIRQVAIDIDAAERDVLNKIDDYCNPMQQGSNGSYLSAVKKDSKGNVSVKNGKIEMQKPMYTQDRVGNLTFSDRANSLKFVQAMQGLFIFNKKKGYPQYKINFSNCKSQYVKNKMKSLTGGYEGTLFYDSKKKAFFIVGSNLSEVNASSIGIFEGVSMKRTEILRDEAREREKKRQENIGKVDARTDSNVSPEEDQELKKYVKDMPEDLVSSLKKLGVVEYRRLIIGTEQILNKILKEKKHYRFELQDPPVSDGFDIEFISENVKESVNIFEGNEAIFGQKLCLLFKSKDNGGDGMDYSENKAYSGYLQYLKNRVVAKWEEFNELSYKENLVGDDDRSPDLSEKDKFSPQEIESMNYGISLLKRFFEEHRKKVGNSYIRGSDKDLVAMKQCLDNIQYTIAQESSSVSKDRLNALISNALSDLADKWVAYTYGTQYKHYIQSDFMKILFEGKESKITTLRSISFRSFGHDVTSSFLSDEVVKSEIKVDADGESYAESGLKLKDSKIDEYFQRINSFLFVQPSFDTNLNLLRNKNTSSIDLLYGCCPDPTGEKTALLLNKFLIIPGSWGESFGGDKIRFPGEILDKCKVISDKLSENKNKIESNFTRKSLVEGMKKQRDQLLMKSNPTVQDRQKASELDSLIQNPNDAVYQKMLNVLVDTAKYSGVNDLVGGALAPVFVDKGGGAVGNLGELYNDIVGYGAFNLNDNKCAFVQSFVIDTVICTLLGLGVSGLLNSLIAKFPSLTKYAESISSAVQNMKNSSSRLKNAAVYLGEKFVGNVKSSVIGNIYNGTSDFNLSSIVMSTAMVSTMSATGNRLLSKFSEKWGQRFSSIFQNVNRESVVEQISGHGTNILMACLDDPVTDPGEDLNFNSNLAAMNSDIWSADEKEGFKEFGSIHFEFSNSFVDDGILKRRSRPITARELNKVVPGVIALKNNNYPLYRMLQNGNADVCFRGTKGEIAVRNKSNGSFYNLSGSLKSKV